MDAPTIAALASLAVAWIAILGLVGPVYLRQGRVEGEIKATRERSDDQFGWARERSDGQFKQVRERSDAHHRELRDWAEAQFKEARERSDTQHRELRDWAEAQFKEVRERSDAQHAETLAEIRRLTDAFLSHSHAPDGGIIFRVPPPSGTNTQE